jgi:hypothetical protein
MEKEKTNSSPEEKKSRFSRQSLIGIFLRTLLVLIVGAIIGAIVYFSAAGWVPYLEQRIFEPVDHNQEQIQEMAATQQALEKQLDFLLEELQENQVINNQDLETAIASAEDTISEVRMAVETANAHSFTQVPALLATLTAQQQANTNHISALATAQMKYLNNGYESELARIIAHLSRANQYLLHANYGLAEDQLIAAQKIIIEMENVLDNSQLVQALELLSAIEGAISDLPEQPALATGKLDLAWQLALLGFLPSPNQYTTGTPSPTPGEGITPTPTQN